jgi:hypothetical protein
MRALKNARLVWRAVYLFDTPPPSPPVWHTSIFDCKGFKGGPYTFSIPRPYRMHTFHTYFHGRTQQRLRFSGVHGVLHLVAGHINFHVHFPRRFRRNSLRNEIPKKRAARGIPAAQAGIAVKAPPSSHPTVTVYKYEEIAEIIGKVGKCFCGVFSAGCGVGRAGWG